MDLVILLDVMFLCCFSSTEGSLDLVILLNVMFFMLFLFHRRKP